MQTCFFLIKRVLLLFPFLSSSLLSFNRPDSLLQHLLSSILVFILDFYLLATSALLSILPPTLAPSWYLFLPFVVRSWEPVQPPSSCFLPSSTPLIITP